MLEALQKYALAGAHRSNSLNPVPSTGHLFSPKTKNKKNQKEPARPENYYLFIKPGLFFYTTIRRGVPFPSVMGPLVGWLNQHQTAKIVIVNSSAQKIIKQKLKEQKRLQFVSAWNSWWTSGQVVGIEPRRLAHVKKKENQRKYRRVPAVFKVFFFLRAIFVFLCVEPPMHCISQYFLE